MTPRVELHYSDIDMERAKLLLDVIVEAGKHGPLFQKLVSLAQQELGDMLKPRQPEMVMPPEGGEEQPNRELEFGNESNGRRV